MGGRLQHAIADSGAQVWCKIHASQSVPGDPHSAAKYRVNAAMLNSQSYLDMFHCPASAKCRVHG